MLQVSSLVAVLLTAGIFLVDLNVPSGFSVWLLYFIPLMIIAWARRSRLVYAMALAATVLIGLASAFPLRDSRSFLSFSRRFLGVCMLWFTAFLLVRRQRDETERVRMTDVLRRSHEELEARVRERTAALETANRNLRESEERFRTLVEHSLVGFFIVRKGQIVFMNPEQERIFGACAGHRMIRDFGCVHPEDRNRFERLCDEDRFAERGWREIDLRFRSHDRARDPGFLRWVHGGAASIRYKGKRAVLVNMIDITRAKELERIALVQEKMASLGEVAAGMAHEIRNPLSGLNIYLTALERVFHESEDLEPENRKTALHAAEQAKIASDKIETVIRQVMDFARPSPPRRLSVCLNDCIREAAQLAAVSLRRKGITMTESLREDLPLCPADPRLIERVLLNIITNAAQAMEGREGEKRIEIRSAFKDHHVVVWVADSGPGVPDHLREKIFDPFFTTRREGTGIGLSISHKVIADHGGYIRVGGSRWGGAEFRFGIPVRDRNRERPPGSTANDPAAENGS